MNRTAPIALAIIATLTLVGCATESAEDKFLRVIHEDRELPLTDAELLDIGSQACGALAMGGGSLLMGLALGSGLDSDDFGYVAGVASATLCPEGD